MLQAFKKIRQNHLLKSLHKRTRLREIKNMDHVRTIGIVFHIGDELSWKYLYAIVQELEQSNRRVYMICDLPDGYELNYIITHAHTTLCHQKEDFDFWGIPRESTTENFLARHYDILIDTTGGDSFFSQYIALITDTDLNITYIDDSLHTDKSTLDIYDLTIHGNAPVDYPAFFENVCNYLQMVKK